MKQTTGYTGIYTDTKGMYANGDVLGDLGRKALDACVKVKIYGREKNIKKYVRRKALDRLENCYADEGTFLQYRGWSNRRLDDFLLSKGCHEDGTPSEKETVLYDIIDIHDALVTFDKLAYVEKSPNPGPRYDELKKLIDKRRADVERECKKAADNPDKQSQYSWLVAQRRVRDCFAGSFAGDAGLLKYDSSCNPKEFYNIIDIHDAIFHWDEASFFERIFDEQMYYSEDFERWKQSSDQRDDVERELNEAKVCTKYSRVEAEQRVKDCYTQFPFPDVHVDLLPIKRDSSGEVAQIYDIFDIDKALHDLDEKKLLQKYPEDEGAGCDELRKSIDASRRGVEKEYQEAKRVLREYSKSEVEQRVRDCFDSPSPLDKWEKVPAIREDEVRKPKDNQTYDIFDIHKMVQYCTKEQVLKTMSHDYSNSSELTESEKEVRAQRDAISKEYQKAEKLLYKYSRNEAERRVKDCFAGTHPYDTDIFPTKEEKDGIPKTQQTYDIFEIKNAIDHFDVKKFRDKHLDDKDPESKRSNERADGERDAIEEEYAEATEKIEIEHGSGFIIHDHFVITNKHVIEDVLNDQTKQVNTEIHRYSHSKTEQRVKDVVNDTTNENDDTKEICISNAVFGELPCEVIHHDAGKDLALLYCRELNLRENGICPLQLSNHSLLLGMQIFAFGFPMSHTEETALFVTGHVSGSKRTLSGHTLAVLNCSLNSGNSGGPILCWNRDQLNVVGVATQKHFKEILTLEEQGKIEKIRESLQTSSIPSVRDDVLKQASYERGMSCVPGPDPCQTPMFLLTLKLYDALETHSQFNLSNALPGGYVVEFIKECLSKYNGEGKEKLAEVVNWSEPQRVNISPTGQSEDKKM